MKNKFRSDQLDYLSHTCAKIMASVAEKENFTDMITGLGLFQGKI